MDTPTQSHPSLTPFTSTALETISFNGVRTQSKPDSTLQLIPLDQIIVHEIHDASRTTPLVTAIQHDQMQRNPIIVAQTSDGSFLHLDGANRIAALERLNCRHAVAQVVDYDNSQAVTLDTWTHLSNLEPRQLLAAGENWVAYTLKSVSAETAVQMILDAAVAAAIWFASGEAFVLACEMTLANRVLGTRQLLDLYASSIQRETFPHTDHVTGIQNFWTQYPERQACICFLPFAKIDIVELAWSLNLRLPAGVTRHTILSGRVLSVNVPLSLLKADLTTAQKTEELQQWLCSRRRRVYAEPTIIYEDY